MDKDIRQTFMMCGRIYAMLADGFVYELERLNDEHVESEVRGAVQADPVCQ